MNNIKSFKRILLTIVLVFAFILGQNSAFFGLFSQYCNNYVSSEISVNASQNGYSEDKSSLLSDNNFATSTSTSYPVSSSYWTIEKENSSIKAGVINLSDITKSNCENMGIDLTNTPVKTGSSEERVLMINSQDTTISQKYTSQNGISLSAGCYYAITFFVWTDTNAFASIYLTGTNLDNANFTPISTNRGWENYTFYIATSRIASSSVGIDLYLGSKNESTKGMVLFDNITITQYSANLFSENAITNNHSKVIYLNNDITDQTSTQDGFVSNNFQSDWEVYAQSDNNNNVDRAIITPSNTSYGTNFDTITNTTKAMQFTANDSYIIYKSSNILIKQNAIYRISFWAKSDITTGTMYAELKGDDKTSTDVDTPSYQTASFTTNPTTNAFNNDWTEYCFYVTGNPLQDTTANLYLGIGSSDTSATGNVIFADITTQKLTYSQKSTATSIGQAQSLNIYTTPDISFANGLFNLFEDDNDATTPNTPTNWTHEQSNKNVATQYGVINVDASNYSNYKCNGKYLQNEVSRPNSTNTHNVLYMRNMEPAYQTYYNTTSKSLDATSNDSEDNGYYVFNIDIQTQDISNSQSGAYVYLKDSNNNVIAWFKAQPSATTDFTKYSIYIKTYYSSISVTPYLLLGTESQKTTGTAFFDNCLIDSSTKAIFDSITVNNTTTFKVDLTNQSFDNYLSVKDNVMTPALWQGTLDTNSEITDDTNIAGIINSDKLIGTVVPVSPTSEQNQNMLFIRLDQDSYYHFDSLLNYSLTANTYYKVSVNVKTALISQKDSHAIDGINPGASIIIDGVDNAQITGIDTTKDKTNTANSAISDSENEFVEYIIYLCPTEAKTITVKLGLGTAESLTTGYAFFDDFSIITIDEDDYKNETTKYDDNFPKNVLSLVNSTEDEESSSETFNPNFDWVAVPTIIIAIAVVVAVVGFMIKRLAKNRKEFTQVSTNYDRLETLLKDVDRRNKLTSINQKLRDLKAELEISEKFLKEETEVYKKETTEYQTAKDIASDTGIELDTPSPETKEHEQTIEQLNDNIAQIKKDIQILEGERDRIKQQESRAIEKLSTNNITIKKRK